MLKWLGEQFDKQRPLFEKGGKLEKLYPLFEAKETFFFTLPNRTKHGAHIRDALDTKRLMTVVIKALLPCLLFGIYNVGHQHFLSAGEMAGHVDKILFGLKLVVPIILVSYISGGVWEVLFSVVRKHEINEGFLVTGLIIPLICPPTIPLWQVAVATSFGVVVGKEIFGGTGMNIFNPALVTRAFLFFAFPSQISGDAVWVSLDGFTQATPLAVAASAPASVACVTETLPSLSQLFIGFIPGSIGETSALCVLIGAVVLLATGVASWRIILSVFIGGAVTATIFNICTPTEAHHSLTALPATYHFVMGGFAFGAVFMATDPVSAAATNIGKWIYGFFIGVLAVLIRVTNPAYPEGMMLAILFMNMSAPLIDYFVVQANIKRRLKRA